MRITDRSFWIQLRRRVRGRTFTLTRRLTAAGLLVTSVFLAVRPATAGPAPPSPAHVAASSEVTLSGGPGFSTVPIRLADSGIAELLGRGMRVDVVTLESAEQSRKVLASMAMVVDVRSPPSGGNRLLSGENKGPLVLIAVPTEVATQVAALSLRNPVTVTLR